MEQQEAIHLLAPAGTYETLLEAIGVLELRGYGLTAHTHAAQTESPTEQPFPGLATQLHVELASTRSAVSRQELQEAFCHALNEVLKIHAN